MHAFLLPEYHQIIRTGIATYVKENDFTVKDVKGYSVNFISDDKGNITGFTLRQPGGSLQAQKNN